MTTILVYCKLMIFLICDKWNFINWQSYPFLPKAWECFIFIESQKPSQSNLEKFLYFLFKIRSRSRQSLGNISLLILINWALFIDKAKISAQKALHKIISTKNNQGVKRAFSLALKLEIFSGIFWFSLALKDFFTEAFFLFSASKFFWQ